MNLLIKQNLSVEQRLQKAVSDIMMKDRYTALAGLLAIGDRSGSYESMEWKSLCTCWRI